MSVGTSIEWTRGDDGALGATWNPVRGCSRVSEGCRNCYAEKMAARFSKPGQPFHGFAKVVAPRDRLDRTGGRRDGWTGKVDLVPEKLAEPLGWKKPRRVFVNSMSDLFHEALSFDEIEAVFGIMACAPQHTFQVLTKRPERMREFLTAEVPGKSLRERCFYSARDHVGQNPLKGHAPWETAFPLPNVWLGVSVEDQASADERIPHLLATPAQVRFISAEPLLGPVNFLRVDAAGFGGPNGHKVDAFRKGYWDDRFGFVNHSDMHDRFGALHWVIVGGESGHGARPCDVEWVRSIVRQCKAAGAPVFVKQLGGRPICGLVPSMELMLEDRKGGDPAEWTADLRVREFPSC